MSFYDDASLAFLPSGGAGKDGKAYSIKPVPEYGNELVTNGGFDTDSDWVKVSSTISGGTGNLNGTGVTSLLYQSNVLTQNKKYYLTFTISNYNGLGQLEVINNDGTVYYLATSNGNISIEFTHSIANQNFLFRARNSAIASIDNVSVKEVIVDGDFTFSRGSNLTATRVDSNGLIEKGRENLLLQSNQFDTTWTTSNTSVTSGQSGYDGSTDAWLLSKSGAAGRIQQSSISTNGVSTFSVYAKANTSNYIVIQFQSTFAYFDLTTGLAQNETSGIISATSTDIGNGWYRCSIVFNISASSSVYIYPAENGSVSGTSGSIYIQDAQLEIGLAVTEVIESGATTGLAGILEDSPRFDYSGGASCPSLLLEPSRTNLVTQSEYFDDATWVSNYTLTPNYTTSPDGSKNAYRVQVGTANGYLREQISVSSSTDYVFSFYAKRGSATEMKYRIYDFTNGGDIANNSYYSQTSSSNWVRIEVPFTTAATTASVGVYIDSDGQGNGDFYVFGAQLEEGSYPTSYIPNHSGGSVTREADAPSNASAASIIGQTEGTIFIDFLYESNPAGNRFSISDGTATNWIFIATPESGTSSRFYIRVNNSVIVDVGASSYFVDGTRYKLALAYKSRDWAVYGNGTQLYVGTDNIPSFSSPMNTINFKSYNPSDSVTEKEKINQVLFFDTRISNGNLATLTS